MRSLGRGRWPRCAIAGLPVMVLLASLASMGCEARVSLGGACGPGRACPATLVCGVGGRCRYACANSSECPAGERCLVDLAVGVPACSIEAEPCTTDCAAGLECVAGQCQSSCTPGAACPDGVCLPGGTCEVRARDDAGPNDAGSEDAGPADAASLDAATPDAPGACGAAPRIADVDVGIDEVCAVAEDGAVYCWGYFPAVGPRGGGVACATPMSDGLCYSRPRRIDGLPAARSVAVGGSFACIVGDDDSVWCWGQLDSTDVAPMQILDDRGVALRAASVAAGRSHVCAVTAGTPAVRCWGTRLHGVLGDGTNTNELQLDAVLASELGEVESLALGSWDTLAMNASEIRAVGENDDSELRVASSLSEVRAVVLPRAGVSVIAATADNTCALVAGHPQCWGRSTPLLGMSPVGLSPCLREACTSTPTEFDLGATMLEGLSGDPFGDSVIGWGSDGVAYGWGSSYGGVLAGSVLYQPAFLTALRGQTTHHVEIGDSTACAILDVDRQLVCWGLNDAGQLGRGTVQAVDVGEATRRFAEPPCW